MSWESAARDSTIPERGNITCSKELDRFFGQRGLLPRLLPELHAHDYFVFLPFRETSMEIESAGKLVKHLSVAMPTAGTFLQRKPLK